MIYTPDVTEAELLILMHAAAELVASLHSNGKVAVEGFYDDVEEIDAALSHALDQLTFDETEYLRVIGASSGFGEAGYSILARQWHWPTIEINGFYGGYQGPASKTVLPSEAHVKLTCRLVPNQNPHATMAKMRPTVPLSVPHLRRSPKFSVSRRKLSAWAAPLRSSRPSAKPSASTRSFFFSVADENIHAPNEFYRTERFRLGLQAWTMLWRRLVRSQ